MNKSLSNLVDRSMVYGTPRQPWRKLLWLKQDYPDNYVDSSFLSQLRRNSTVTKYSFYKLATDFSLVNLHLCDTSIIFIIFFGLYSKDWPPYTSAMVCSMLTIFGYAILDLFIIKSQTKKSDKFWAFKSTVLIVFLILTLSPVLRSLTKSTSSDSIWALSTWLTIFNIICHNYEYDIVNQNNYRTSVLSTNIFFANIIVLSSRLNSNMSVFCFILVSIQIYGIFPIFQFNIRKHMQIGACFTLSAIYFVIVSWLIYVVVDNYIIIFSWFLINLFIISFCPAYFIFLQQYKNELQGPWDPAKPQI